MDASVTRKADWRVLLWMPRGGRMPGGHVVQIEKTARALGDAGVEVLCDYSSEPDLVDIDLVHGFGLSSTEIRRCHTRRVPVAMSTIYWDRSYRSDGVSQRLGARSLAGRGVRAVQFARSALHGRSSLIEASLQVTASELAILSSYESADLLLPNAVGEAESIRRDLGVSTPMAPVPNGVDPVSFSEPSSSFEDRDYVLFVGRIDPHKNQLGAIRALRGSGLRLVIAGDDHPHHPRYAEQCREEGGDWVTFTGQIAHDSPELSELYRGARVHVLPSWFETTGLVSLEAALCGCSVVSTSRGHAREYLDDLAWYCDPGDPASILRAVRQGWDSPPSPALRQRVLARYTWEQVATVTIAAYHSLLEQSSVDRRLG
jgi:glycosyltransferase involved in cell wall biosynthesis